MQKKKFKLKRDISFIGYKTLTAGTIYEAVRENSRYIYIEVEESRLQVRLSRADCEEIKRCRKPKRG